MDRIRFVGDRQILQEGTMPTEVRDPIELEAVCSPFVAGALRLVESWTSPSLADERAVVRHAQLSLVAGGPAPAGDLAPAGIPAGQAIEMEEAIRKRLVRDLHDGPMQLLSGIFMRLEVCRKALERDPPMVLEQIDYIQDVMEQALDQMRTMLFELRPTALETQGLSAALRILLELKQRSFQEVRLTLRTETRRLGGEISRRAAEVEAALFDIVQEAVNNALKHARATQIVVHLQETPASLQVAVVDDGIGMDVHLVTDQARDQACDQGRRGLERWASMGLLNVRERAESIGGELEIRSMPGLGTRVSVSLRS